MRARTTSLRSACTRRRSTFRPPIRSPISTRRRGTRRSCRRGCGRREPGLRPPVQPDRATLRGGAGRARGTEDCGRLRLRHGGAHRRACSPPAPSGATSSRCGRSTAAPTTCSPGSARHRRHLGRCRRASRARSGPTPRSSSSRRPQQSDARPGRYRGRRPPRRSGSGARRQHLRHAGPSATRPGTAPRMRFTARPSSSAATATWSPGVVACDADRARRLRQVRILTGALLHPWPPTCSTAACRRSRSGCGEAQERGTGAGRVARRPSRSRAGALSRGGRRAAPWAPERCSPSRSWAAVRRLRP